MMNQSTITAVIPVAKVVTNEVLFTNTYALFKKVANSKKRGESLSECMSYTLSQSSYVTGDFFEMKSSDIMRYFGKEKLHQKNLVKQIEQIYYYGIHTVLETSVDQKTKLIEVSFNGYFYSFLVDFREFKRNVVILTNFYSSVERTSINHLFAEYSVYCEEIHSVRHGRLKVINTYDAFCSYASYQNAHLTRELNKKLFPEFLKENGMRLQYDTTLNENDKIAETRFSYVQFRNAVIMYEFVPVVVVSPVCQIVSVEEEYEEDDYDYLEDNISTLRDLEEWGAFTDEGIYPSDWD